MKIQFLRFVLGALLLGVIPLLPACNDTASQASVPVAAATVADAPVVPPAPVAAPAPVVPAPVVVTAPAETAPVAVAAVPAANPVVVPPAVDTNAPVIKQTFDPSTLELSPGVAEIVKLAQSGVAEEVMLEFVTQWPNAYRLAADEVVYLNDLGVPDKVITAMLKKEGPAPVAVQPPPAVAPAPATAPTVPVETAPATTTVVQQPVYVTQPTTTVTHQYFYDSLAPYGSWIYLDGYGYCWQPTVAVINVGWRPYYNSGRWVYSTYGWYWNSDYTWGWAPFHYGRWHMHGRHGWVWMPDTVWGPSWVTWRYHDGYCGWAPLPPGAHYATGIGFTYYGSHVSVGFGFGLGYSHYSFVSARHFTSPHLHQYGVHGQQNQTIYNNSTVINNYINGDNNTIINRGIGREEIARQTRTSIPTMAVKDLPASQTAAARPDRIAREGNQNVIYRQTLPTPSPAVAERGGSAPVRGPAPAVAALSRENRASSVSSLAGGSTPSTAPARTYQPPTRNVTTPSTGVGTVPEKTTSPRSGSRTEAPANRTTPATPAPGNYNPPTRGSRGSAVTTPATPATPSAPTRTSPAGSAPSRTYTPPAANTAPAAPVAPSAPTVTTPDRRTSPASPSYTPPTRSTPANPTTPSYTPPARSVTPSAPSYTPPERSLAPSARTVTPSAPSYTPPTRSLAPSARTVTPAAPTYTPPARSVTPSAPSYTPPARSVTPSAPAYSPPARSAPAPSAPSYTPPSRSAPAPSTPSYAPSSRGAAPSTPANNDGRRGR